MALSDGQTLVVAVPVTVEVDVTTWVREFRVFPTDDALRNAVRSYVYDAITATPAAQQIGGVQPLRLRT